jgi:thiol-disulfide isomerase/thioredoxin
MTKTFLALTFLFPAFLSLSPADAAESKPLAFSYVAIDGSSVDIADDRGKVVLLLFWATWSKPSRDLIPGIVRLRKKYRDQGFEVLGVSLDSDENTVQNYIGEYNMPWPEYFDGRGEQNAVAQSMRVKTIPTVWIVGKDGLVAAINPTGDLDPLIGKLIKVPYSGK